MSDTPAYISTSDPKVLAILSKERFNTDVPDCVSIPRELLPVVEELLAGLTYVVAFSPPEDRKKIVRGKWDKYESGWGPDPFHTVGD